MNSVKFGVSAVNHSQVGPIADHKVFFFIANNVCVLTTAESRATIWYQLNVFI